MTSQENDNTFELTPEDIASMGGSKSQEPEKLTGQSEEQNTQEPGPVEKNEVEKETPPQPAAQPAIDEDLLGSYKKLRRATEFTIDGQVRQPFGKAIYTINPYVTRTDNQTGRIPISIPTMGYFGAAASSEAIKTLDFRRDETARQWARNVDDGIGLVYPQDGLFQALYRDGSNWEQRPTHNGQQLSMAVAKAPPAENTVLKESDALLYALNYLDLGVPTQVPLWNSGIWVSFRPATEEAWVNFNERLQSDKILFGRTSSGLIFSNINALFQKRALEFAFDHLMTHNVKFEGGKDRSALLSLIREPDINHLLWGFLNACHPSGYPINRGCTGNIGVCKEEISDTIMLQYLQVTDSNALTDAHRDHMCRRAQNSVTEAEVLHYQKTLPTCQDRVVEVLKNDRINFSVKLSIPTIQETIDAGTRWIDGIITMVDSILDKDATDKQREKTYNTHARSSTLREYSHFIKEVLLNSNTVEHQSSIEMLLTEISPRGDLRQGLYEKISDFIEKSVVSVVAVPNYECPSCNKLQREAGEDDPFVDCIPLDVCQAFFNLALLRYVEINNR